VFLLFYEDQCSSPQPEQPEILLLQTNFVCAMSGLRKHCHFSKFLASPYQVLQCILQLTCIVSDIWKK
jgi:hypothetical protein